jgi:hypothetical protein
MGPCGLPRYSLRFGVRRAPISGVPPGRIAGLGLPGNELPGYYQSSLWDKDHARISISSGTTYLSYPSYRSHTFHRYHSYNSYLVPLSQIPLLHKFQSFAQAHPLNIMHQHGIRIGR